MRTDRHGDSHRSLHGPMPPVVKNAAASALDNSFGRLARHESIAMSIEFLLVAVVILLGRRSHRASSHHDFAVSLSSQAPTGPRRIFLTIDSNSPLFSQMPPHS